MTRSADIDYMIFERLEDADGVSVSFATRYPIDTDTLVVWLNGVRYSDGFAYAAAGNVISFVNPPYAGDVIQIAYQAMHT